MNTSPTIIKLEQINKVYDSNTILDNFTLEIHSGERLAIFGSSGRGKTTLLHLIAGLEPADKGNILIHDNAVFAMVFQEDRLLLNLSAMDNLKITARHFQASLAAQILSALLLNPLDKHPVSSYSGGMKRRAAIARALYTALDQPAGSYPVLILDEALRELDKKTAETVLSSIKTFTDLHHLTLLMATHNEKEATALGCDCLSL